ncbi:MAG TPA: enoyl-CoA hydratase-related protein [Virgibacillus sp.]|nr:enoyl-CoA hydratase-related protein [Virgibacillus sp.]
MASLIDVKTVDNHIAVVTLNRPAARNALSRALLSELYTVIKDIDEDSSIHCTILTGSGTKAFCAGADLKERKGMPDAEVIGCVEQIGDVVSTIERMKMPVIALINGAAFGGGLELALGCDIRLAASHSKMGLTETSLAIIPGAGGTQRLPRLIGMGKAKKMIFSATALSAEEGLEVGLIDEMLNTDDLLESALQLARKIAANGPIALRQAKTAVNHGSEMALQNALIFERQCYKETIPTEDRMEGLIAFQEKRKPDYRGK